VIVDLTAGDGRGPLWGDATDDLNLTLLAWPPGEGPGEHVNEERDVVLVVLDGSGTVMLDGDAHDVHAGTAVVVQKGARRGLTAGPEGILYLTVHRRRGGLQIAPAPVRASG
jgi:quercetin dioxygenase-like cupin family protein